MSTMPVHSCCHLQMEAREATLLPGMILRSDFASCLLLRQAQDVSCKQMNLVLAEEVTEGRHLVGATVGHGLDDRRLARAVQPALVGQVGGSHHRVAGAVGAVAGHAL